MEHTWLNPGGVCFLMLEGDRERQRENGLPDTAVHNSLHSSSHSRRNYRTHSSTTQGFGQWSTTHFVGSPPNVRGCTTQTRCAAGVRKCTLCLYRDGIAWWPISQLYPHHYAMSGCNSIIQNDSSAKFKHTNDNHKVLPRRCNFQGWLRSLVVNKKPDPTWPTKQLEFQLWLLEKHTEYLCVHALNP